MAKDTLKRILGAIPVFLGITLLVFLMVNLIPGTVFDLAGEQGEASNAAQRAALEAQLGFDQPVIERYFHWLGGLARGDFGNSLRNGQPVGEAIGQRIGPSLILTGAGIFLALLIGIPLGVMAAARPKSVWGKLAGFLPVFSFGVPGFCLCLLGIFFFSVVLGLLPASGMYTAGSRGSVSDLLRHLVLPASIIAVGSMGNLVRQTRSACLEVLGQGYILAARAKGLGEGAILTHHVLPGAAIPILTTVVNHIPHLVGGSMVVERIFGWPGMGSLFFQAVSSRDYTMIMGVTVLVSLSVLGANLLLDLLYPFLDPRVRGKGGRL